MNRFADNAVLNHLGDFREVVVCHVLRSNLNESIVLVSRFFNFLCHFKLRPVSQRLFAVNVFTGVEGVNCQRSVKTVRGGNADDVYVGVSKQVLVFVVHLAIAQILGRCLQTRAIDVANGNGFRNPFLLEVLDNALMFAASSANANKTDANAFVSPRGRGGNDVNSGNDSRRCNSGRFQKISSGCHE